MQRHYKGCTASQVPLRLSFLSWWRKTNLIFSKLKLSETQRKRNETKSTIAMIWWSFVRHNNEPQPKTINCLRSFPTSRGSCAVLIRCLVWTLNSIFSAILRPQLVDNELKSWRRWNCPWWWKCVELQTLLHAMLLLNDIIFNFALHNEYANKYLWNQYDERRTEGIWHEPQSTETCHIIIIMHKLVYDGSIAVESVIITIF